MSNNKKWKTFFKKIISFPLVRIFIGMVVVFLSTFIIKEFAIKPILEFLISTETIAKSIQHLFSVSIILAAYYLYFQYTEKRKITELSPKHILREGLQGLGSSFLLISIVISILFFLGYYQISGINDFSVFLLPLTSIIVFAVFEEILYRGIAYRILEKWIGTNLTLIISALLFGIFHISNDHVTLLSMLGIIIGGLLLGIMFTYTKRLWLPIFFHIGWNFSQIIYGTTLSGTDEFGSFFQSKLDGPQVLTGSNFGIEDSSLTLIATLALFMVLYHKTYKKGNIIKPPWFIGKK